jgi:choline dehydrogenase-like flavoprotein
MLSGIGDSSTLSNFGIDTLVDIPDIGQNLQVKLNVPTTAPYAYLLFFCHF